MIYLVLTAIIVALLGGILAHALSLPKRQQRMIAFAVPLCISAALLHIVMFISMFDNRLPAFSWGFLSSFGIAQGAVFLAAFLLTGIGWLCAYCIQNCFED